MRSRDSAGQQPPDHYVASEDGAIWLATLRENALAGHLAVLQALPGHTRTWPTTTRRPAACCGPYGEPAAYPPAG